jgi:hypothetical protein
LRIADAGIYWDPAESSLEGARLLVVAVLCHCFLLPEDFVVVVCCSL